MLQPINNSDEFIDSRDVIERIEELELECGLEEMDEDDVEEYEALKAFAEEADTAEDWEYGTTFIHDNYFTKYAEEMAKDLYGADLVDAVWPHRHIDWDAAAEELKQDYTSYDFNGETYWAR